MGILNSIKGFIGRSYGAGSISGEKDNLGNIRVYACLGEGEFPYLGMIKPNGKFIKYFTPDGKQVERPVLE